MDQEFYETHSDIIKKIPEDVLRKHQKKISKIKRKNPILPSRVTTEYLMHHLSLGYQGMIMASELGEWLRTMEKSHNGDLKQTFTNFYDCDMTYTYCTKHSGSYVIENPFVTINAVSTIDWVKSNINSEDIFSGFFARFLLFAPPASDVIPPSLPTNGKQQVDKESESYMRRVLREIEDYREQEIRFSLSDQSRVQFDILHSSLYHMVKNNADYGDKCQKFLEPYLKRWSPYLLKLAMIFNVIENPKSQQISVSSLKAATEIIKVAIKSTAKLFQKELGESENQRKQRIVFEWFVSRTKAKKPTLFKNLVRSKILEGSNKEYEGVLETLQASGSIKCFNPGSRNKEALDYRLAS